MPTLLEGEALAIWLGLSVEEQDNFSVAKEKLINAMNPTAFVYLKGLLDRAMPKVEKVVCDQLLLHQCLTGLPDAVSRQIRAAGDVKTLDAAVEHSRLLTASGDDLPMVDHILKFQSNWVSLKYFIILWW